MNPIPRSQQQNSLHLQQQRKAQTMDTESNPSRPLSRNSFTSPSPPPNPRQLSSSESPSCSSSVSFKTATASLPSPRLPEDLDDDEAFPPLSTINQSRKRPGLGLIYTEVMRRSKDKISRMGKGKAHDVLREGSHSNPQSEAEMYKVDGGFEIGPHSYNVKNAVDDGQATSLQALSIGRRDSDLSQQQEQSRSLFTSSERESMHFASIPSPPKLDYSLHIGGYANGLTEIQIEKLAVGNGRPRLPSSLGHLGEFSQQQSVFSTSGINGDLGISPIDTPEGSGYAHASLCLLNNGITSPNMKSIAVGSQTGASIIRSVYSKEAKGSFQIWFLPDYVTSPASPIESQLSRPADYEQYESYRVNSQWKLDLQQPPPPNQRPQPPPPTSSASFIVNTPTSPESAVSTSYRQQNQNGAELRWENGARVNPAYANIYEHFENIVAEHTTATARSSVESVKDNQSFASPSSGHEFYDQAANVNNFDYPYPRQLQLSPAEKSNGHQPQGHFQGCEDGIRYDDTDTTDGLDSALSALALQMLEAGVVPDDKPDFHYVDTSKSLYRNMGRQRGRTPPGNGRNQYKSNPNRLEWRGRLLPKDSEQPCYSGKIFVGGIHPTMCKADLSRGFHRFGVVDVSWCAVAGDKVIHGCAYVLLRGRRQVEHLLRFCRPWFSEVKCWKGQRTWHYDMPYQSGTVVLEVIPWDVLQGEYICPDYYLQDPANEGKCYNVFLGNLHARFSANDLAMCFINQGFTDVKSVRLGMDKYEYPVGFAKVTFGTSESFVRAVRAQSMTIQTPEFSRTLQIEPFIDGNPCSLCTKENATVFCRNEKCCSYYCQVCCSLAHSNGKVGYNHKGDVVTRVRRFKSSANARSFDQHPPYFPP